MVSVIALIATLIGLALLLWRGSAPERWAALSITVYLCAVPMLEPLKIHDWRMGVAVAEACLFLVFWYLAERSNRWWLTAAAGFQLISVLTFAVPLVVGPYLVWTGVALRMAAWGLVVFTLFFAAYEVHVVRRYSLEPNHG